MEVFKQHSRSLIVELFMHHLAPFVVESPRYSCLFAAGNLHILSVQVYQLVRSSHGRERYSQDGIITHALQCASIDLLQALPALPPQGQWAVLTHRLAQAIS